MNEMTADRIMVSAGPAPGTSRLARQWRDLEKRASPPFFLSWDWLGPWLEGLEAEGRGQGFWLIRAESGQRCVGLGLVRRRLTRRWGVPIPALYLNQSGHQADDSPFIEFNGFLAESGLENAVTQACLQHLIQRKTALPPWQEFHLSGVPVALSDAVHALPLPVRIRARRPAPFINLEPLRQSDQDYLSALSRNTRQQIRRAMRLYEGEGPLRLQRPDSLPQALAWLEALKHLHERSWQARGRAGAFSDPFFDRFCQRLVQHGFEARRIDLVRATAGDEEIGYLLNLVEESRVLNYQSGFAAAPDGRFKPGLVTHALAIQSYLEAGRHAYSFLAGAARYKLSLATDSEDLIWLSLQRPTPFLRAEHWARRIRCRWRGKRIRSPDFNALAFE